MKVLLILLSLCCCLLSCSQNRKPEIWMIGDSTMAKKSPQRYPESGWGEGLKYFVKPDVQLHNHAASGRSTKSFIDEGRWKQVLDSLHRGDFVIIQFGHNDEKPDSTLHTDAFGSFKNNLENFVKDAESKGARPIICSSVVRRKFSDDGQLTETHGDYIPAAKQAATETNTPYVDMDALTAKLVQRMGPDYSKAIYNFTSRKHDSTHPNQRGAKVFAYIFAKAVVDQNLTIANSISINHPLLLW